jgi:hypothetical protein
MFEVNGVYANRNGKYTVLSVNGPKMRVRYENGNEAELNMRVQSRIWENIVAEQEEKDAKEAIRRAKLGMAQNKFYIKVISIPDADELMFPGWQEKLIMALEDDAQKVQSGDRIIYYALEPQIFFGVATITGDAKEANPKDYFYTIDLQTAHFFPVDMDAEAAHLEHGMSVDSVELESYPRLRTMRLSAEMFLEISEDDFELLAEMLTEVSEDEIEEDPEDFEEEEEDE